MKQYCPSHVKYTHKFMNNALSIVKLLYWMRFILSGQVEHPDWLPGRAPQKGSAPSPHGQRTVPQEIEQDCLDISPLREQISNSWFWIQQKVAIISMQFLGGGTWYKNVATLGFAGTSFKILSSLGSKCTNDCVRKFLCLGSKRNYVLFNCSCEICIICILLTSASFGPFPLLFDSFPLRSFVSS